VQHAIVAEPDREARDGRPGRDDDRVLRRRWLATLATFGRRCLPGRIRAAERQQQHPCTRHHAGPTRGWVASFHAVLLAGCQALPELTIETDRLRIGTSFDAPVCEGTLAAFDDHVNGVETSLGQPSTTAPILLYWLEDVGRHCGDDAGGCFFPGTRVVFAQEQSITHEIVHAVLDSSATSYFVEEGIAELYSGADVWHRPAAKNGRPADALHMSKTEYRKGGLDYAAAAHFMRYVFEARGESAMKELAGTIASGGSTREIEDQLEKVFDLGVEDIETAYFNDAPTYYEGFSARSTREITSNELWHGVEVELDCDDDNTRGPLRPSEGGVYEVRWLDIDRSGTAEIRLDGEASGWVYIFDPVSSRGSVTNWAMPQPEVDEHALQLYTGETAYLDLHPGTYLVVFGADDDRTELELRLRLPQVPGPLGEQG
jgi:hypothetical protein